MRRLLTTFFAACALLCASAADYTTWLTAARGFTEVTTFEDMIDDASYYYILVPAETTDLIVGIGRYEGKPDWAPEDTKALRYRDVNDPAADISNFFTIEKTDEYIGFRNVVYNTDLFQTHDNAGYMYVNTYSDKNLDEWSYLKPTYQNGYWLFESGKYPMSSGNWACGYLGPWNKTVAAGEPIALNRRNEDGDLAGHYRLFRITKDDLTSLKRTPLYSATPSNPVDATGFIINPSFETGDETGWALIGKDANGNDEFKTRDYGMTNKDGQYLMNAFQWWSASLSVSQTVENVPSGEYELSGVVATWENRTVTFSGNESTVTTDGQGDGTGIPVSLNVTIGKDSKLIISAGSSAQWWNSGHESEDRTFFKLDNVQLMCKQLYLNGMAERLPNDDVTLLEANQWYYFDISINAEYYLIGNLNGLVYSTDGDKTIANVSTNSTQRKMTLAAGRYYFKTTRSDATLYIAPLCSVNEGTFTAVALNVDGLPNKIAWVDLNEDGPGESGTKKISQYLASKGYDFIGCSEDFNYNGSLMESLNDNYSCGTIRRTLSASGLLGGLPFDTDGLNLIWKNSKINATNESWTRWNETTSTDGNQYIKKGYRHYDVLIDGGALIDVFILHMDAGDASDSRHSQWEQLAGAVNSADATRPKLIIGDTNSRWTREEIAAHFKNLINSNFTVSDVWVEKCRNNVYPTTAMGDLNDQSDPADFSKYEVVDKIMYINPTAANTVRLEPQSFKLENDYTYNYVDQDGNTKALGDHRPVVVEFKWMKSGDAMNMPISLADNTDNTKVISNTTDVVADVTLSGRTLYKDGAWNTLCLPFSLDATQVTNILAPAEMMELDVAKGDYEHQTGIEGSTLYLNFKNATSITAGKPYIIKWNNADNWQNPTFNGVTIYGEDITSIVSENNDVIFRGVYAPKALTNGDKTNLFLGADNTLQWPNVDNYSLNAFRAYFHLSSSANVRQFVLNFGDGEITRIENVQSSMFNVQSDVWYTLDGRRLTGRPAKSGLYIRNGQKQIVK